MRKPKLIPAILLAFLYSVSLVAQVKTDSDVSPRVKSQIKKSVKNGETIQEKGPANSLQKLPPTKKGTKDTGMITGLVTELATGNPVQDASIHAEGSGFNFFASTTSSGIYEIGPVEAGNWSLTCSKNGYNIATASIMVNGGDTIQQDFQLTAPTMSVSPEYIVEDLTQNEEVIDSVTITNNGNGSLIWNAQVKFLPNNSKDLWDLIFDVPVGVGGGEAGIETDGNYIYTSKWNGSGEFYKYNMDGTYIGQFVIPGAAGCRDMAFDGTYMYGGAANTTVFQMDFNAMTMVSTFTAPTQVRAIAYNEDHNSFYANNWDTDITEFDITGATLTSFPCGPFVTGYYGFAYDNYSDPGTPYLWGYAQDGTTLNELIQIDLTTQYETGLTFDVGTVVAVGAGIAGGLAIDDHIDTNFYALLGTSQNEDIWALELCSNQHWCYIEPQIDTVGAGEVKKAAVHIQGYDLLYGPIYFAEIGFSSLPDVGKDTIVVVATLLSGWYSNLAGTVTLEGLPQYNIGNVTDVVVQAGPYSASPDTSGHYTLSAYPGTYDATATLYGYDTQTSTGIVIPENGTVTADFTMPCLYGMISGIVTDTSGMTIEEAAIEVAGTMFNTTTSSDGTYSLIIAAGTYDLEVTATGYQTQTVPGIVVNPENNHNAKYTT